MRCCLQSAPVLNDAGDRMPIAPLGNGVISQLQVRPHLLVPIYPYGLSRFEMVDGASPPESVYRVYQQVFGLATVSALCTSTRLLGRG